MASKLSINDNVTFKGSIAREERVPIYDNYKYFILPSLSENFGIAAIEALSRGCKVLVSTRTPWTDYIHPYLTVFEPDHKAICAAIKSTLAGENIAIPRGAESVLKLDRFRWRNIALEFNKTYFDKKYKTL